MAVARTLDGFELAEADFELRREGDVLGLAQSGLPRLRVASLQRADHRTLAVDARRHAEALLDEGGELRGPALEPLRRELVRRLARGDRRRRAGERRMSGRSSWRIRAGGRSGRPRLPARPSGRG